MADVARSSSHQMLSPSYLCPSSCVNWKILASQAAGMRLLRLRPSTLVWRSLEAILVANAIDISIDGAFVRIDMVPTGIDPSRSEPVGSSFNEEIR
ncbi:hypothetical protein U1Q18_010543 [Sarracenia purpurea var. burkii]